MKAMSEEYGSANQIPSPFIHLHNTWEVPCVALGVCTPRARYPDTDRGLGPTSQTAWIKQIL
jgi:hypothetical protein